MDPLKHLISQISNLPGMLPTARTPKRMGTLTQTENQTPYSKKERRRLIPKTPPPKKRIKKQTFLTGPVKNTICSKKLLKSMEKTMTKSHNP
jgi:hypothetical protein